MLKGHTVPFQGFGEPLPTSAARLQLFLSLANAARLRVEEGFRQSLADQSSVPSVLDSVIDKMWREDWSPAKGNFGLFTTDFGLIFADAIVTVLGGDLVFRSETDISNLSVWWPRHRIEVFPLHHVWKCLQASDGASLAYFFRSVSRELTAVNG
jgi:hypothetical protein